MLRKLDRHLYVNYLNPDYGYDNSIDQFESDFDDSGIMSDYIKTLKVYFIV